MTLTVVTGAAGFIGSHLVDELLVRGGRVLGIDQRDPSRDEVAGLNLRNAYRHATFEFRQADVTTSDLTAALAGCDTVYHLAGRPGVRSSWGVAFEAYVHANLLSTNRLIAACEAAGVRRLVLASSSSVYGDGPLPSREHGPVAPSSPYGVTKLAAESLCGAHARRASSGLTTVALRYFSVYGPRQRSDMAIRRILDAALSRRPVKLYGDGTQRREFTYVSDVVDATVRAAALDAKHAVFNVGGGSDVSLLKILSMVSELTDWPIEVDMRAACAGEAAATSADLTAARDKLGYWPRVDLRAGIAAQLAWQKSLASEELRSVA